MQDIMKSGVSRRTVVKGAAWTVPAIAVAAAAPAIAATPLVTFAVGLACKHPGNPKHYHFNLDVTNNGSVTTTVTITSAVFDPSAASDPTVTITNLPDPFTIGAHDTVCIVVDSDLTQASSNGTLIVSYDFTDENGVTQHFVAALDVSSLPPCQTLGIPDFPHLTYTC
jgi:hypothetical protein